MIRKLKRFYHHKTSSMYLWLLLAIRDNCAECSKLSIDEDCPKHAERFAFLEAHGWDHHCKAIR